MPLTDTIGRILFFSDLDASELQKIADIAILRTYPSKSNVFMEGQERHSVYFIKKGIIKIYKIDTQGSAYIVAFLKEGEMFPHAGFFDKTPYPGTAEVVLDAELCVIPIKAFENVMLKHPEIAIKVMREMSRKIREMQAKLQELSSNDIHLRLTALLLRLADGYGKASEDGLQVTLKLTHSDIAQMVGTTRETVTRYLNKLKKERILHPDNKNMVITDRASLENLLESLKMRRP